MTMPAVQDACCPGAVPVPSTDLYKSEYGDEFVARWDALIGWQARAASEGDFFLDILRRAGARRILDAACGTGFHTVQLAEAGFEVTATDGAAAMVARTEANLAERGLVAETLVADWRDLGRHVGGSFDAVFCLGNSLGHLFSADDRRRTLSQFFEVLKPGGLLVLDHRNYDAILDGGRAGGCRQGYCCCGGDATVTVRPEDDGSVRITYSLGAAAADSYTIRTCPVRLAEMTAQIAAAGFLDLQSFGDFHQPCDIESAEFFIHVARKPLAS